MPVAVLPRCAISRVPALRRALAVLAVLLALGAGLCAPATLRAEPGFATLVADRVFLDGPNRLIAEGNVEALSGQIRLRASRIVYDRRSGALTITGPLTMSEGDRVLILADAAELQADMQRGLIRSARVILDQQLQIAAYQVDRHDARYTEMSSVIASACEICDRRQTPLWEVRAARVIHDDEAQQIYFENAQFRLFGVPVVYLPRLRVPDPRLERATGWLSPRFSVNTGHGVGLRAPYFIALANDKDLTLTPFVSSKGTAALDLRYRQAFASGTLEIGGLVARDRLRDSASRGYAYAEGAFALGRGVELSFNLVKLSDRRLLEEYNRAEAQVTSDVTVQRIQRDERFRLQALHFRSLRLADQNRTLPNHVGQALYERRLQIPGLGGAGALRAELHSYKRRAPLAADVKGVSRLSLDLDWRRDAVLPAGVLAAMGVQLGVDHFRISPAATAFARSHTRVTPTAMAELRWPLLRNSARGATHVIEPVAQLVWRRDHVSALPNDISRMPEIDEGNLFANDRFAGREQREAGRRANLGIGWGMHNPDGWSSHLLLGRVYRERDLGQFSAQSPLAGGRSDWLMVASLDTDMGLTLSNRALFASDLRVSRNALEVDWAAADYGVSSSYVYIRPDLAENRPARASEWSFEGRRNLDEYWTARVNWRYDIAAGRAARIGAALNYENECLRVDVGLERQFASATTARSSTSFALNLDVLGIGGNPSRTRRSCSDG